MAAFAGATAANALDYEDGHYRGGGIHAGSAVLPALLAATDPSTPMARLRRALVVGYEIAIRAGYVLSPQHGRSYRTSGHAASLGAAGATAALLGGDVSTVASALRIAASHAPVSTPHAAGACESIGWAATTAVTAAFLALDGFTNEQSDATLAAPVSASPFDDGTDTRFVESLGRVSEATNCYIKPYACCRLIHAAIDGLHALDGDLPEDPGDVKSIVVGTQAGAVKMDNRQPLRLEQAQFSIPIMLALYLTDHELGPAQARPSRYEAKKVRDLATRIRRRPRPPDGQPGGQFVSGDTRSSRPRAHDSPRGMGRGWKRDEPT